MRSARCTTFAAAGCTNGTFVNAGRTNGTLVKGPGSKMDDSLVAKWKAARAGEGPA